MERIFISSQLHIFNTRGTLEEFNFGIIMLAAHATQNFAHTHVKTLKTAGWMSIPSHFLAHPNQTSILLLFAVLLSVICCSSAFATSKSIYGTWYLDPKPWANESSIPLLRLSVIDIINLLPEENATLINFTWTDGTPTVIFKDSFKVAHPYRSKVEQPVSSRIWPYNVYSGIEFNTSETRYIETTGWVNERKITFEMDAGLLTQQGRATSSVAYTMEWESNFDSLEFSVASLYPRALLEYITYTRTPPKMPSKLPTEEVYTTTKRIINGKVDEMHSINTAYVFSLPDQWKLSNEDFQMNAMLIGLQGLVNRYNGATLYLRYPETWAYSYTPAVQGYFASKHGYDFQTLNSSVQAVKLLYKQANVKGYVIYDTTVRESLVVAYTAAGVHDALVVTNAQVPLMKELGLNLLYNFTGQFQGQTPEQIYSWAKAKFWSLTSKTKIVWAGGIGGDSMHPGIMDYGVSEKSFFTDLSTLPSDTKEYNLASKLVSEMGNAFYLLGWHSYNKDFEHTFTTLASKYGGRVHGLNTNPNLSFQSKVAFTRFCFQK